METNYHNDIYVPRMNDGVEYQDWILKRLHEQGIILQPLSSKKGQLEGENLLGLEIKYDRKMAGTGNIYIEVAEKSNPANEQYVPSGIYRQDNSWLFGIGDYTKFFIFTKRFLKKLHKEAQADQDRPPTERRYPKVVMREPTGTSRGFTFSVEVANLWAAKVLIF